MKIEIDFQTFLKLASKKIPIAISAIVQADQFTPTLVFEKLYRYFGHGFLAEITHTHTHQVVMGFEPRGTFQVKNNVCQAWLDEKIYTFDADVLEALRRFHAMVNIETPGNVSGLVGGMMGLISYDAIKLFEKKLAIINSNSDTPQLLFYCYKINVVFDHRQQLLSFSVVTQVDEALKNRYETSVALLQQLLAIIEAPGLELPSDADSETTHEVNGVADVNDLDHQRLVHQAKTYIQQGDIFQVVLSRSFNQACPIPPFNLYRMLRSVTPAPYLFYLDDGEQVILGASPEKLVSVQNRQVETVTIAGTCRATGQKAVEQLLQDEKELAEHVMLVDLARNDLGKVCTPGSVKISDSLAPKTAGNLLHLTTLVSGELASSFDAFDALKAVFPAGTVSGAPKIRAMEIIEQLETTPRGFYAGAICFVDHAGNLDSAILIRTMQVKDGVATVRAGSGVVFDSVPEKEAQECRDKADSILRIINVAEEKIHVTVD